MMGDYLDNYTYESILQDALSRVPNTVDKREGSIIYDALAPACAELTQAYIELKGIYTQTYVLTATGEHLDLRAAEEGLDRFPASYAIKRGIFTSESGEPRDIPIGNRFSSIGEEPVNYIVVDVYRDESENTVPGNYMLQCENAGVIGNAYIGNLLPVTPINNLAVAYMDNLLIPARDEETDEELRFRYFERVETKSFGGNIADYNEKIKALPGVGEVQIYPVWNGGGTVKCSIIGVDHNPASQTLIEEVQEAIDPNNMTPQGLGLGIAPIDHTVTIETATPVNINIEATISLTGGYDIGQVRNLIEESIGSYLLNVRKQWGTADDMGRYYQRVFISQVNFAILSVPGIANVTGTTINGADDDLYLTEDKIMQELPMLGEVVVYVN